MMADRPLLGIALMLGFCLLAPMGDSIAKVIGDSVPVAQLIFLRFGVQVLLLLPLVVLGKRMLRLSRRLMWLTFLRTLLHIVGIGAMFLSLRYLPLADAVAIAFVMPFIMLLLGKYVLGEEVGSRRLSACVVGFIGTMLVIQPSFAAVGPPALLPLLVAVVFALFMLVTRHMAKEIDPIALQTISGTMAVVLLAPLIALGSWVGWGELSTVTPDLPTWGLLCLMGVLGTIAHLLMTWSLRFAPSATLAPMQYLEIPIATVIGWLVFRDFPNGLALIGIAITICAGLYVIYREQVTSRQAAPSSPPQDGRATE